MSTTYDLKVLRRIAIFVLNRSSRDLRSELHDYLVMVALSDDKKRSARLIENRVLRYWVPRVLNLRRIIFVVVVCMVVEGDKAPVFTLEADDGRHVSLKNYLGKKLVLYFYPKDNTPGCTTEAVEFRDVAEEFEKQGAVIVGVSKDSVESHKKFKEKHNLPFTLLSDPEGKVLDLYGVWKRKSLYGRTFMGTERTTFLIDEKGIVVKVYRKVKAKGHAQTCLLDLRAPQKLPSLE